MNSWYLLNSVEPNWLLDIHCNISKLEMRNFTSMDGFLNNTYHRAKTRMGDSKRAPGVEEINRPDFISRARWA